MADDERHDPRCPVMPCTCADIARRVREADARRACQIRGPSTPGFVQSLPSLVHSRLIRGALTGDGTGG